MLFKWVDTAKDVGVVIAKDNRLVYFNQKVHQIFNIDSCENKIKKDKRNHLK